jgi:hypothetical protein
VAVCLTCGEHLAQKEPELARLKKVVEGLPIVVLLLGRREAKISTRAYCTSWSSGSEVLPALPLSPK